MTAREHSHATDDPRIALAQIVHRLRERFGPLAAAQMLENAALDLQREADRQEAAEGD